MTLTDWLATRPSLHLFRAGKEMERLLFIVAQEAWEAGYTQGRQEQAAAPVGREED